MENPNFDPPSESTTIEDRLKNLESQISAIQARNRRVETSKTWETSKTRLLMLTFITFITMSVVFHLVNSPRPFFDAIISSSGFLLSSLSIPMVRKIWEAKFLQ